MIGGNTSLGAADVIDLSGTDPAGGGPDSHGATSAADEGESAARRSRWALGPDAFPLLDGTDRERLDRAIPLVYNELRAIAHRYLAAQGGDDTLNSTALVHEAYLKLGTGAGAAWRDRVHFLRWPRSSCARSSSIVPAPARR